MTWIYRNISTYEDILETILSFFLSWRAINYSLFSIIKYIFSDLSNEIIYNIFVEAIRRLNASSLLSLLKGGKLGLFEIRFTIANYPNNKGLVRKIRGNPNSWEFSIWMLNRYKEVTSLSPQVNATCLHVKFSFLYQILFTRVIQIWRRLRELEAS